MSNELVVIEQKNVMMIFTEKNHLDEIIKQVEMEVATFEHDLSNDARRKKTASLARKVASTKTYLDLLGKDLVSEWKEKSKIVDSNRKAMRDRLDELRDLARKPLTDWENEQAEIEAAKAAAEEAKRLAIELENAHEVALFMNADFDRQAEQARVEAEAKRIAYEEALKAEAAAKAKAEAEAEAIAEKQRIEQERQDAINREIEAKAEAKRQEQMRLEVIEAARLAAERAEQDRIIAEQREKEAARQAELNRIAAEERVKRDAIEAAEAAKQAEIKRQQDEQARIAQDEAKRQADIAHTTAICTAAKLDLISAGLTEEMAILAIKAIRAKAISHVSIKF